MNRRHFFTGALEITFANPCAWCPGDSTAPPLRVTNNGHRLFGHVANCGGPGGRHDTCEELGFESSCRI